MRSSHERGFRSVALPNFTCLLSLPIPIRPKRPDQKTLKILSFLSIVNHYPSGMHMRANICAPGGSVWEPFKECSLYRMSVGTGHMLAHNAVSQTA